DGEVFERDVGGLDAQERGAGGDDVAGAAEDVAHGAVAGGFPFEDGFVAFEFGGLGALGQGGAGLHEDVDHREFADGGPHGGHRDVDQKGFHQDWVKGLSL